MITTHTKNTHFQKITMLLLAAAIATAAVCLFFQKTATADTRSLKRVKVHTQNGGTREIGLYSGYHALVVGCADYRKGWRKLRNPVKDAEEVAKALAGIGFEVKLIKDPDSLQLRRALNGLADATDPQRGIFVFFAGHGHTLASYDGKKVGYIVPVDAPDPDKDRIGFMTRAVSMQEVEQISTLIRAKHVLMAFDSCFSGSIFRSGNKKPSPYIREQAARPVRAFITAGEEHEQVPDESVFKTCMIQGLVDRYADRNRDGYVTGDELGLYLEEEVVNYSNGAQHPRFGRINKPGLDKGDFVFHLASSGGGLYKPGSGTLTVQCNVSGARVLLDGKDAGRTPLVEKRMAEGKHRLSVEKSGYETYRTHLEIDKNQSASIDVILTPPAPRTSRLYVNTEPVDARVRIMNINPAFQNGMELEPGSYDLKVSASGFFTYEETVRLREGEDRRVSLRLQPRRVEPVAGEIWKEPVTGMEFVWVPEGCFEMGQTEAEKQYLIKEAGDETYRKYYNDELPRHRVCVDGFWMGKCETTRGQFRKFVKDTGYRTDAEKKGNARIFNKETDWKWKELSGYNWKKMGYDQDDAHPVGCVSWNDAAAFAKWLSGKSGKNFGLPTEAQWEYAARGGVEAMRFWGDGESDACLYANAADKGHGWPNSFPCDDGYEFTAPVGKYKPNPFGLYDMLGNVWEWCADRYGENYYSNSPEKNPQGPSKGGYRVLRGGSWFNLHRYVRCGYRSRNSPDYRDSNNGFRLVALPSQ